MILVDPWVPMGEAFAAYSQGERSAIISVNSDVWKPEQVPVAAYYRPDHQELPTLELKALSLCRSGVLDVGAGAGRHSLELQRRGLTVRSLEVCHRSAEVCRRRGVTDVVCDDIFSFCDGSWETLLLLQHGIGVVGTLAGLDLFLRRSRTLLAADGLIVCDSADISTTVRTRQRTSSTHYAGEVVFQLCFRGTRGRPYPWLFVDPTTLERHARSHGFTCEIVARAERGRYLAVLS